MFSDIRTPSSNNVSAQMKTNIAEQIEALRKNEANVRGEFREQLARARELSERFGSLSATKTEGVDRSRELLPLQRPAFVRALFES